MEFKQSLESRTARLLVLAALSAFQIRQGLVPAWSGVQSDFPNYYTASRLLMEGADAASFYNDDWFRHRIRDFGMNLDGKFSPFPPSTALLMAPLAMMTPLNAQRAWTALNIAILAAAIALLTAISGRGALWAGCFFLLSGQALANNLRFGQIYLALTFLVLASYLLIIRRRDAPAGALMGIVAGLKYLPVVFLAAWALQRRRRAVAAGLTAAAGLLTLGVMTMGWPIHAQYFGGIIGPHLDGVQSSQTPFAIAYQSWNSLFRNLFLSDPSFNPTPIFNFNAGYAAAKWLMTLAILGPTIYLLFKMQWRLGQRAAGLQFALCGIAGLALIPAGASYHFLFLILPAALLINAAEEFGLHGVSRAALILYAAIGFVSWSPLHGLAGGLAGLLLSYPRLWLMTGLWLTNLIACRKILNFADPA